MHILHKLLKNKEALLFTIILLIGAALRLYRLPYTMQFLGDQGRDALIARAILMERDPAFIGPVTSVGNMYLGPFYYYFMVAPLMMTYPNPVGPAIAVALVGIVTLALIFILGKEMIGKTGAFLAMLLYAVSPVVITNVRFSWNPNIVPFFSLLLVWAIWKTWQKKYSYWMLVGLCAAVLFQLHYIALILIGCAGLIWIVQLLTLIRLKSLHIDFIKNTAFAIVIFLLSLIPILIFDTKHDWLNTKAFLQFFQPTQDSPSHFRSLSDTSGVSVAILSMFSRVVSEFFAIIPRDISQKILVSVLFVYMLLRSFFTKEKDSKFQVAKRILTFCLALSVVILSLYSASVFDHYLGFIFPIVFLAFGFTLSNLWKDIFLRPLVIGLISVCVVMSLLHYPGTQNLGSTIYLFERSSREIATHIPEGMTFNILSYSPTKDLQGMNYRYYLTTMGKKPAHADDWTSFQRLVIIDEEHRENPIDEEQYVIKLWPNRTIIDSFEITDGPKVYILER